MILLLLILLTGLSSYIYIFLLLRKSLNLTQRIMTPGDYLTTNSNYTGYVVFIEQNMIINDFYFLKKLLTFLSQKVSYQVVSFELSANDPNSGILVEKLKVRNIPSIHYINKGEESREIFNFVNVEEDIDTKSILNMIEQRLEKK
ncbi:hypothetical protein [Priestia filamentosa]|uniref:hypothetical protein n=1 Tax=Priestia filamentosa TaxID=1402861 RepID=UPI003982A190